MTSSGTRALELTAASLNLNLGDEIIFPSYTFVGTVNPFVLYGANPVFVDVKSDSIGSDIELLEKSITKKTKAIVVVHYNGIGCDIDKIRELTTKNNIVLIEDNAQGFMCKYKNQMLGTFGDLSILSFNYTKNIQCGEGGALIVNNEIFLDRIEKAYNSGTNKGDFEKKLVKNYEWVSVGSKFYPSQLECAVLLPQLEKSGEILKKRIANWDYYYKLLSENEELLNFIYLPVNHSECLHFGHIFYIRVRKNREELISFLKKKNVEAYSHYTPLHLSKFGKQFPYFGGNIAKEISESILRLPIHNQIEKEEIKKVVNSIYEYYIINKTL
jgi:dTDP-4-amino-4,6-dideoxygalactose transaminase